MIQRELDDDLSAEERAQLDAHVAVCAACRAERHSFELLAGQLFKLDQVKPDQSFVGQMDVEIARAVRRQRRPVYMTQGLAVAAAVVLGIGVATQWTSWFGPQAPQSSEVAQVQLDSNGELLAEQGPSNERNDAPNAQQDSSSPDQSQSNEAKDNAPNNDALNNDALNNPNNAAPKKYALNSTGPTAGPNTPPSPAPVDGSRQQMDGGALTKPGPVVADGSVKDEGARPPIGGTGDGTKPGFADGWLGGGAAAADDDSQYGVASAPGAGGPTVGEVATFTLITPRVQQEVKFGNAEYEWATDPLQVVQTARKQLGFRTDAVVSQTNAEHLVTVRQDGAVYGVFLDQLHEQGARGVWSPVQIGRVINTEQPQADERSIVDWFTTNHYEFNMSGPIIVESTSDRVVVRAFVEGVR